MPIYEYACLECGTEFEKLVWNSQDAPALKCPACGESRVEQKVSACASFSTGSGAGSRGPCAPSGG